MKIGIYPELKPPRFHQNEGKDIAIIVLDILKKYGYTDRDSGCILQCFDPETLKRVRHELKAKLFLVQLIAENAWNETPGVDYTVMLTTEGIKEIATYANGIGPWLNQVIRDDEKGGYSITELINSAHALGLKVHPYTHRTDLLPGFVKNEKTYLDLILKKRKQTESSQIFPMSW